MAKEKVNLYMFRDHYDETIIFEATAKQVNAFNKAFGDFDVIDIQKVELVGKIEDIAKTLIEECIGSDWKSELCDESAYDPETRVDVNAFLDTVGIEHV